MRSLSVHLFRFKFFFIFPSIFALLFLSYLYTTRPTSNVERIKRMSEQFKELNETEQNTAFSTKFKELGSADFIHLRDTKETTGVSTTVNIEPQNQSLYISSVYYVTDTNSDGESTRAIRMIALGEKNIANLTFSCSIDGEIVAPIIKNSREQSLCKFASYLIDCKTDAPPESFSLIGSDQKEHVMEITAPDLKPRKLVVCFSRMFYYEKWQTALASLELYKSLGVDLMVIPISSVIEKLHRILKAYEKEGNVRLKPAIHIPQFTDLDYDPNTETEWFQQITAYTECMYDYRESAEFILTIDIDDFIIPKHFTNLQRELDLLSDIFPLAASFEFLWAMTSTKGSSSPGDFSISRMINESNVEKVENYGKSIIRPKRLIQLFVHHPYEIRADDNEVLPGFHPQILSANYTLAIHLRKFTSEKTPNSENYFSKRAIFSKLDKKFHAFLKRNPEAKTAYMELPSENVYLDAMLDCYVELGYQIRNNTLDYCVNPIRCTPDARENMENCVVLKQEYKHTQMSESLRVARPVSSKFELRSNCFY